MTPADPGQLNQAASGADSGAGTGNVGDTSTPCSHSDPAEIAVHVQTSDGKPVEGASASVNGNAAPPGVTGSDGVHDFGQVPPDTYTVSAQKDGFAPSSGGTTTAPTSQTLAAPAGASTQFELLLNLICPTDFVLNAPCKILKAGGGAVQISASELPGMPAGTYAWTTTSSNITLTNEDTATVSVSGPATPSASRDAETITVTRTATGCQDIVKTVTVTVATVVFSASPNQLYGYDDFDTPSDPTDDHICVKKSDHTFLKVDIQGGALGTDFDFVCDDPSICTTAAAPGTASFDLRLDAGDKSKNDTPLNAKVKCASAESFAKIQVHVYKERFVEVVVAKVYDSTVGATSLNFPTADYGSFTDTVNGKLKEAVVKYSITNYDPANNTTDVHYDLDANGAVSYDIKNNGGAELDAIKAAITGTGTKTRVVIVRNMKSYYYLSADAAVGATTVTVTAGSVFNYPAGRSIPLGLGAAQENVTVASSSGSTITLGSALTKAHTAGAPLEFPAGGWGSDPILIIEGNTDVDTIKWTVPHEVGHRTLNLLDIVDETDFMHWMQSWTDHRLRYCPRTKKHEAGTENQWELIPR